MATQSSEWWYAEGTEQRGPVSLEEITRLVSEGTLDRESLVWHAGMAGWTPAGLVSELGLRPKLPTAGIGQAGPGSDAVSGDLTRGDWSGSGSGVDSEGPAFEQETLGRPAVPASSGAPAASSARYDSGHMADAHAYGRMTGAIPAVGNNLVLAVFATVLCCLPLGIVSIVKASQVKAIAGAGDVARAQSVASEAKKWALWAIGIGLVFQILYAAYIVLVGGSALSGLMDGTR